MVKKAKQKPKTWTEVFQAQRREFPQGYCVNYYGTSSEYITALEGIRNAAGENVRILYSEGCDISTPKPDVLSREYHRLAEAKRYS